MAPAAPPRWAGLLGVGVLALLLRTIYLLEISRTPLVSLLMGDALSYDTWARQIAGGQWVGKEVFYQAPLYPYFLGVIYALAGHSLLAVRLVQIVLGSAACVLLARAGQAFLSRRAGLIAGVLLAVYPTAIFFDLLIEKSVLDSFFLCLLLALMGLVTERPFRGRGWGVGALARWIGIGLALACLMLTRENALVLVVVVAAWALLYQPGAGAGGTPGVAVRLARLGLLVVGLVIALGPVVARNYGVGHEFHLTTSQFGPNFYIGNNPHADGTYRPLRPGRGTAEFERRDATELAQDALHRTLRPEEVSRYWTGQALGFIRHAPLAWLRLLWHKNVLLWNRVELGDTAEDQYTYAQSSWVLWCLTPVLNFGTIVPLAWLGLACMWERRRQVWVIYTMLGVYAASVVMFYVFARYRFPLVPLMLLPVGALGAACWTWLCPSTRRAALSQIPNPKSQAPNNDVPKPVVPRPESHGSREYAASVGLTIWALAGVALGVWVNIPAVSIRDLRANAENNIGRYIMDQLHQPDLAMKHYDAALALKPDFADAHNNLGVALEGRGHRREAAEQYLEALRAQPGVASIHYNLALLLAEEGQLNEAISQFDEARRLNPDEPEVWMHLGSTLATAGHLPEAAAALERAVALNLKDATAHNKLGTVLARQGKLPQAAAEFAEACRLAPGDLDARFNLGNALRLLGRYDEAAAAFEKILKQRPGDPEATAKLAEVRRAHEGGAGVKGR